MRRERGKLRIERKFSPDPSFVEWLIVIGLTGLALGIAFLPLLVWPILLVVGGVIAHALGFSAWYGVGVVFVLFLLSLVFGRR